MEKKQNIVNEDQIDLRELIKTIIKRKYFILLVTFICTFGAIIYSLVKTPLYEGKALVEIGEYLAINSNSNSNSNSSSSSSSKVLLDDQQSLVKRLNIIFIDLEKNKKDKKSKITIISTPKKNKKFYRNKS